MPVVVSQKSGVQLLGVPKIFSASGQEMADAVFTTINDWNIEANIVGVSFDITNSNKMGNMLVQLLYWNVYLEDLY